MATRAAAGAFVREWTKSPAGSARQDWLTRRTHYEHMWHLHENSKFDDPRLWEAYKARHGLGRSIRMIYNPTRRLCDFYAGIIYPGILAEDGRNLPNGTRLAIPLADDTPPELRAAIGQIWQWSNWQASKSIMPRWGAMTGNAFVEIIDDMERGQVRLELIWPGLIEDLDRDAVGNLIGYTYAYDALNEETETTYTYRRRVDMEAIREYNDQRLIAETPNPYGFVPAVWVPHVDTGMVWGGAALRSLNKLDELNDQASAVADRIRLIMKSPIVLWGGGSVAAMVDGATKAGPTAQKVNPYEDREQLKILQGPVNGEVGGIALDGVEEAYVHIDKILGEIEHDHPELTMYSQLRSMSQVTGPGAERMLGDAAALIDEARGNYDHYTRLILQKAIAVAGHRASTGDWGPLNTQQAKFTPFDLDSYARGDLNFDIMPRPIIPETPRERLERERMEMALERERNAPQQPAGGIEARVAAMARQ